MDDKYQLKLKNQQEIGPLTLSEISRLYLEGQLILSDYCKEISEERWVHLQDHPIISKMIKDLLSGDLKSKNLSKPKKKAPTGNEVEEFQYLSEDPPKVEEESFDKEESIAQGEKTESYHKTVILDINKQLKEEELLQEKKRFKQLERDEEKKKIQQEKDERLIQESKDLPISDTMIKQNPLLSREANLEMVKSEEALLALDFTQDTKEEKSEEKKDVEKKQRIKPIAMIAIIALIWFVFFDKEEKEAPFRPRYMEAVFPIANAYKDIDNSYKELLEGIKNFNRGTYLDKLKAVENFQKSLSYNFRDNPALGFLIRLYAELLPMALVQKTAVQVLYKLLEIGKAQSLFDINITLGLVAFYSYHKQYDSSFEVLKNYIRYNKNIVTKDTKLEDKIFKVIQKLQTGSEIAKTFFKTYGSEKYFYSKYMLSAMKNNYLEEAEKAYVKVFNSSTFSTIPFEVAMSGIVYLRDQGREKEAEILLGKSFKRFKNFVKIKLFYCDFLIKKRKIKELFSVFLNIEKLKFEYSPLFYADYLERKSVYYALQKNYKMAALFIREAIEINDTDLLRMKLSQLEVGGDEISKIVLESKAMELIREAKILLKEKKFTKAVAITIEAVELLPERIDSRLFLIELQIKRGYFSLAFKNLKLLTKKYPLNLKINKVFVNAYIEASKIHDAKKILNYLSRTKFVNTPDYAFLLGKLYAKQNQLILTIKWFNEAIKRNPMNVNYYFLMAETYLRHRQYRYAKINIIKGLDVIYSHEGLHVLYARILYETESVDRAIGYLRENIQKFGYQTRTFSEIAIYYYRSGQLKNFYRIKKEIMKSVVRDKVFYMFLIEASLLEEEYQKVILYYEEYLELNPGDLQAKLNFSFNLQKLKEHDSAIKVLQEVKFRLEEYPKLHFYLSENYYAKKDYKKALEMGLLEIKFNPHLPDGHFITGKVYYKMNNFSEAIKQLDKTLMLEKRHIESIILLGEIRFRQDLFEDAQDLFLKAQSINPNEGKIYQHLGYNYMATGQSVLARESFETYLKLTPESDDFQKIQNLIKTLR